MSDALEPLPPEQRELLGQQLDRLLQQQRDRVRWRFLLHGVAVVLLVPAAWIGIAFLLDHFLHLPAPIRVFHTLVAAALLLFTARRFLLYPLSRRLQPVDVALVLEQRFPELHERLVSAVQLKAQLHGADGAALRNQSPDLIAELLADAAAAAPELPLHELFDPTRTTRLWLGAAATWAVLLGGAIAAPASAWAFLLRHLGRDVSYPRATQLIVELPPAGSDLQRQDREGLTELVLPTGADLHVSVLAQGVVPEQVFLDIEGSGQQPRSVTTVPRSGGRFRHVFRRIGADFAFRARGGDDDRGDRLVSVRTIHPPLVAQIKAELRAPAYTGQPPVVQNGGSIEALLGTEVTLSVVTTTPVSAGAAVFLESGRRLELVPTTVTDDAGTITAQVGTFVVERSDRYQIELVGETGLRNPSPGTYPVTALQDYAPVGRWLLPEDESGTLLLPNALLCLRGDAHDDFGLAKATLAIDAGDGRTTTRELLAAPPDAAPPAAHAQRFTFLELLEVQDLLAGRSAEGLALQLDLLDNREPAANATQLPRRLVQIVDQAQLAAAIGRQFRSLREEVEQTLDLQKDRAERLQELREHDPAPGAAAAPALTAIEVGQGRIQSAAERTHRGAMRAFDLHLWNRLEPSQHAQKVVEIYRDFHRAEAEQAAFAGAFYRQLRAAQRQGTLGSMETTLDPILGMVLLADRLQGELAPAALRSLAAAQVAKGRSDLEQCLATTVETQRAIVTTLEELLARLDEWNDYQDLVQEARALREKQRDVKTRTEEIRGKR